MTPASVRPFFALTRPHMLVHCPQCLRCPGEIGSADHVLCPVCPALYCNKECYLRGRRIHMRNCPPGPPDTSSAKAWIAHHAETIVLLAIAHLDVNEMRKDTPEILLSELRAKGSAVVPVFTLIPTQRHKNSPAYTRFVPDGSTEDVVDSSVVDWVNCRRDAGLPLPGFQQGVNTFPVRIAYRVYSWDPQFEPRSRTRTFHIELSWLQARMPYRSLADAKTLFSNTIREEFETSVAFWEGAFSA